MSPSPAITSITHEIPVEVLRIILESAFETYPLPVQFSLVSWGVKNIVEPLIYRDISISTTGRRDLFLRTWNERHSPKSTKSASFYQAHVKGFFIRAYMDADQLVELLLGLPGLQNLGVHLPARLAPIRFCFHILRANNNGGFLEPEDQSSPIASVAEEVGWLLSPSSSTSNTCKSYFKNLRRFSSWAWFRPDDPIEAFSFTHQFFQNLTHLDILVSSEIPIWESLHHLQNLTHVSFSWMTLDSMLTNELWEEWVTRLLAACPAKTELIIFWCISKDTFPCYSPPGEDSNLLEGVPGEFHQAMLGGPPMSLSKLDPNDYHFLLRIIVGWVDPRAIAGSTDFTDYLLDRIIGDYVLRTQHPKLHEGDWDSPDMAACPDFWSIGEEIIKRRRRAICL